MVVQIHRLCVPARAPVLDLECPFFQLHPASLLHPYTERAFHWLIFDCLPMCNAQYPMLYVRGLKVDANGQCSMIDIQHPLTILSDRYLKTST